MLPNRCGAARQRRRSLQAQIIGPVNVSSAGQSSQPGSTQLHSKNPIPKVRAYRNSASQPINSTVRRTCLILLQLKFHSADLASVKHNIAPA